MQKTSDRSKFPKWQAKVNKAESWCVKMETYIQMDPMPFPIPAQAKYKEQFKKMGENLNDLNDFRKTWIKFAVQV